MQVTEVAADGLKRTFDVVVDAAEVTGARDARLGKLAREMRMPGFRPGKVPMSVVRSRYGASVLGEVLEEKVGEATQQVVTDRGLRPAQQPRVEPREFGEGQDLSFRIELEVMPEIPMPDFAAIEVERLRAEASDDEVEETLGNIAKRGGETEEITEERPAAMGDVVVVDFVGRARPRDEPEGALEEFAGGSGSDMPVELGGEGFIPGFADGLVGVRVGETREVEVAFPAEYQAAELAGRPATFTMTAKALRRPVAPVLDDAFAEKLGIEGGMAGLRERIRESIQQGYDQTARVRVKRKLLDALAERADFPVPQGMVQGEFDQIWAKVEEDTKAGRLDAEDTGKDEAMLRAEYRAIAERRIRLGLLVSEIGRTNGVKVEQDELLKGMRTEAQRYPGQERQVLEFFQKNPQAIENLRAPIFEEKVVDFMLELARVTDRTVPVAELRDVV